MPSTSAWPDRSDHAQSMRAFAQMFGLPIFWATYEALVHLVLIGQPAFCEVSPKGFQVYLAQRPDAGSDSPCLRETTSKMPCRVRHLSAHGDHPRLSQKRFSVLKNARYDSALPLMREGDR